MGLDPKDVEVVAQLAPILSRHHLSVTPIIGVIPADVVPSLVPFPAEVASIFTVPLHYFLEDHPRHSYEVRHSLENIHGQSTFMVKICIA